MWHAAWKKPFGLRIFFGLLNCENPSTDGSTSWK